MPRRRKALADALCQQGLDEHVGTRSLSDPLAAWKDFRAARISGHAPAGQDRYRSVLQAAINYYYEELGLPKIKIPSIKFDNERVRFLELDERDLLISWLCQVRSANHCGFRLPRPAHAGGSPTAMGN